MAMQSSGANLMQAAPLLCLQGPLTACVLGLHVSATHQNLHRCVVLCRLLFRLLKCVVLARTAHLRQIEQKVWQQAMSHVAACSAVLHLQRKHCGNLYH